jgi:hypothetical protein
MVGAAESFARMRAQGPSPGRRSGVRPLPERERRREGSRFSEWERPPFTKRRTSRHAEKGTEF